MKSLFRDKHITKVSLYRASAKILIYASISIFYDLNVQLSWLLLSLSHGEMALCVAVERGRGGCCARYREVNESVHYLIFGANTSD